MSLLVILEPDPESGVLMVCKELAILRSKAFHALSAIAFPFHNRVLGSRFQAIQVRKSDL